MPEYRDSPLGVGPEMFTFPKGGHGTGQRTCVIDSPHAYSLGEFAIGPELEIEQIMAERTHPSPAP